MTNFFLLLLLAISLLSSTLASSCDVENDCGCFSCEGYSITVNCKNGMWNCMCSDGDYCTLNGENAGSSNGRGSSSGGGRAASGAAAAAAAAAAMAFLA